MHCIDAILEKRKRLRVRFMVEPINVMPQLPAKSGGRIFFIIGIGVVIVGAIAIAFHGISFGPSASVEQSIDTPPAVSTARSQPQTPEEKALLLQAATAASTTLEQTASTSPIVPPEARAGVLEGARVQGYTATSASLSEQEKMQLLHPKQ